MSRMTMRGLGTLIPGWRQGPRCGGGQHLPGRGKAGSMTGAIPTLFERIPMNGTAEVGTRRRALDQSSVGIPMDSHALEAAANYRTFPGRDGGDVIDLSGPEILPEMTDGIDVLQHH